MMKTIKKGIAVLLSLVLLLTAYPIAYAQGADSTAKKQNDSGFELHKSEFEIINEDNIPLSISLEEALSHEQLSDKNTPMYMAMSELTEEGYVARVRNAEFDLNSVVLSKSDGTMTLFYYSSPIKYIDNSGRIKDKSLDLMALSNGDYRTRDNDIITTFSASFSNGIHIRNKDIEISMIPIGISADAILLSDKKTVVYQSDSKTRYEYVLTSMGIKENIIVESYTGQTEYSFILNTQGLALVNIDGTYTFVDKKGDFRATLSDIVIFTADDRNNTYGSISVETIVEKESYVLTIRVNDEWLSNPNTRYPITIDPTLTINTSANIEDVSIVSTTTHSGTSGSLYVGRGSSGAALRVLMRFPNLDVSGYNISSATISIRDIMCEGTEQIVECYEYTGNLWSESSSTNWSTAGNNMYSGQILSCNNIKYGNGNVPGQSNRYSFDITSLARKWADGTASPSKGILFKSSDTYENDGAKTYRTFASINRGSNPPILTVEYTEINNSPSLNFTAVSLYTGDTVNLLVSNITDQSSISWSSTDSSVATVNEQGVVTALAEGTATITAIYSNTSCSCVVTVNQSNVNIISSAEHVPVGSAIQLHVTTVPENRNVLWESSNNEVAEVSSDGVVTIKDVGSAIITAELSGGEQDTILINGVLEDGIYRIQSTGSYLNMAVNYLFLFSDAQPYQLSPSNANSHYWRITHIGDGVYTITAYMNSNKYLAYDQNRGVVLTEKEQVTAEMKWLISKKSSKYVITNCYNSSVLAVIGGEGEMSPIVLATYSSNYNTSTQRWYLYKIESPQSGILWKFNTSNYASMSSTTSITLAPQQSITCSAMAYSEAETTSRISWVSSNSAIAKVSEGYIYDLIYDNVTDDTIINAIHDLSGVTLSIKITIKPFADTNINIVNAKTGRALQPDNNGGDHMEQHDFDASTDQFWSVFYYDDLYYEIRNASSGMYLTASTDMSVGQNIEEAPLSASVSDNQLWKFIKQENGQYTIKSKCWQNNNLVISLITGINTNGTNIQQWNYSSDDNLVDEWLIDPKADYFLAYIGKEDGDEIMPFLADETNSYFQHTPYNNGTTRHSLTKGEALLRMSGSNVVAFITHGTQKNLLLTDNQTITYDLINNLPVNYFQDAELIYYGACLTGSTTSTDSNNIVNVTFAKGATCVVGFNRKVLVTETNTWTCLFMRYIAEGKTINEAIYQADEDFMEHIGYYPTTVNCNTRVIVGNSNTAPCWQLVTNN